MKKVLIILIAVILMRSASASAADTAYKSKNGVFIDYTPIESYIINGETYIPAEKLLFYGFDVKYDADSRTVNINRNKFSYPVYTRDVWKSACRKQTPTDIFENSVQICLGGEAVESLLTDNCVIIRIDELKKYGTVKNNAERTDVEIFRREIEKEVESAENQQEIDYSDGQYGKNHYTGQVNSENRPDGWGKYKYDDISDKVSYTGHFTNGEPDGLTYKETFRTVVKSYTNRYVKFIGEVDGKRKAKREYISSENGTELICGENFNGFTLPFIQIPEWTGPETHSDDTVYLNGCYYEYVYGKNGTSEHTIWYGGTGNTSMMYARSNSIGYSDIFDRLSAQNPKIYRLESFYEYDEKNEIFYDSNICTSSGDGTDENPIILNAPEEGGGERPIYISIEVNGNILNLGGSKYPILKNGRTLVPLRIISENMGAEVSWEDAAQTATIVKDGKTLSFKIGGTIMLADNKEVILDESPQLIYDTTFVPIRAVCDGLGVSVDWNEDLKRIVIK